MESHPQCIRRILFIAHNQQRKGAPEVAGNMVAGDSLYGIPHMLLLLKHNSNAKSQSYKTTPLKMFRAHFPDHQVLTPSHT